MTNPTNTDLAAALREIADTLVEHAVSALIVRLAADRLGPEADGWITYLGKNRPDLPKGTRVEIELHHGEPHSNGVGDVDSWMWNSTIKRYRVVK